MFRIPVLLLGLNLGGTLAAGFGERPGSQPDPIASIEELIEAHEFGNGNEINSANEQPRAGDNLDIYAAPAAPNTFAPRVLRVPVFELVPFAPSGSGMRLTGFDCNQDKIKESLKRFATMREKLSKHYDLLAPLEDTSPLIVQSFSRTERSFLRVCIIQNNVAVERHLGPKEDNLFYKMEMFRKSLPPEKGPFSEQARKVAESDFYIPRQELIRHVEVDNSISPDQELMIFCEETCGKIVEPLKGLLETGLELLEAARSIKIDIKFRPGGKHPFYHFDYLLCKTVKDNLSKKASSSRRSQSDTQELDEDHPSFLFADQQN